MRYVHEKVPLWRPSGFEIPQAYQPREVENVKGSHSETFPCIKQQFSFLFFFEMTNPKTGSSEIRKAQSRLYWAFRILEDPVNQR